MTDEIKVGTTLNSKYELMAVLGKGSKSTVYKGYQHYAKRSVAVKVLNTDDNASASAEIIRFQHEGKIAAKLAAHPGIADALDFGAAGAGQVYIVTALIEGSTLKELLTQKKRLDADTTANIFKQVADILAFVHEQNILHRALNPSEIMLTPVPSKTGESYKVTVLDFGSAQELGSDGKKSTDGGDAKGTPGYASPEQTRAETLDARSDIYSVGCMMYETLVGKLPEGFPPQYPAELRIPEDLQEAVTRALSEDREKRFASMKELSHALPGTSLDKKNMWDWTKRIFK